MIDEQKQSYEFGEFRLDVLKRQLLREGEVVPLYSKAFDLLLVLVQKGGGILTKDELLEAVWPGQILEEANLTVTMSAVRKALGEKATQPRYIVNIPGRGYRFLGAVRDEPGAMVIESETIARITVEEETTDDEIDPVAAPPNLIASGEPEAASVVSQWEAKQLGPVSVERKQTWLEWLKKNRVAAGLGAAFVTLALIVGGYALRQRQNLSPAPFAQVQVRQLTTNKVRLATLSPDGKLFAYVTQDFGQQGLWLGQTDGGNNILLRPLAAANYFTLAFSADGSSLFFSLSDDANPNSALFRMPAFGGAPERLRDGIAGFALAPDGRSVVCARHIEKVEADGFFIIGLDGNGDREIASLPPTRSVLPNSLSISPDGDGKQFAFVRGAELRDVVLITSVK